MLKSAGTKIAVGLAALALGFSSNAGASSHLITTQTEIHQNASEPLVEIYQPSGLESLVQSEQNNMVYRIGVPGVTKNTPPIPAPDKIVYLSFDDGPKGYYWETLSILNTNNAKATFCLVGYFMEQNPDFIRAAVASGQSICNHTYDHPYLTLLSNEQIAYELNRTDAIYDAIINPDIPGDTTRPWMRLPYGDGARDPRVISTVNSLGYAVVMWHLDADDRKMINADAIVNNVVPKVKNGSVVLMHLVNIEILNALPRIIDELHARGYQFVTFDGR